MRAFPATCVAAMLVFAACAPKDDAAMQSESAVAAVDRTLADFAGTWSGVATVEGTSEPVPVEISGTEDPTSWKMTLRNRPDIPLTVSIERDSLITLSTRYESVLREGVMVMVRTANVLQNGALMGQLIATYDTPTGQELAMGTMTATKTP